MPPKKSAKNKAKDDYWDNEYEQDVIPTQAAPTLDTTANEGIEEESELMSLMKKSSQKKKDKKKKETKFDDEDEKKFDLSKLKVDDEEEEEMWAVKKGNKKKGGAAGNSAFAALLQQEEVELEEPVLAEPEPVVDEPEPVVDEAKPTTTLKTAKQKEKEKKERQKEEKKKAAAAKKAVVEKDDEDALLEQMLQERKAAEAKEAELKAKKEAELKAQREAEKAQKEAAQKEKEAELKAKAQKEENEANDASDAESGDDATANNASKSKNKKKKKKKAETVTDNVTSTATPTPSATASKKKPNAAIAALQQQMAAQRAAEEAARLAEEQRLAAEEAARLEQERLERLAEEAKQRKKEKEREKKELLKKQGKWLTPSDKERLARNKMAVEMFKAAGMVKEKEVSTEGAVASPSTLESSNNATAKKKPIYGKKKKFVPSTQQQQQQQNQTQQTKEEETEVADRWDATTEDEGENKVNAKSNDKEEQDNKEIDEWDAESEEEKHEEKQDVKQSKQEVVKQEIAKQEVAKQEVAKQQQSTKQESSKPVASQKAQNTKQQQSTKHEQYDKTIFSKDANSSSDEDSEDDSDEDSDSSTDRLEQARQRRLARHQAALAQRNKNHLRSPICCILGHVDTGKTKLLDKIRQTNVQEGEAGGITQQIGATYFPVEALKTKIATCSDGSVFQFKIPGLLMIDTPGHESFSNLRSRGSSLCQMAVLVVDLMHGLEPQTIESLQLLRMRKTPFVVALNKIDRLFGWQIHPDASFEVTFNKQNAATQREFRDRLQFVVTQFAEQGLNAALASENPDWRKYVSLVPTSAVTGEGVNDLLLLVCQLTQERMTDQLMFVSSLECTVLEVKVMEGLGTTLDVILSNGTLREGDRIVVCGLQGAIVTTIRALLTPQPLRELRVKSAYQHHHEMHAAMGLKIVATDLEKAIAGTRLLRVEEGDDEDELCDEVMRDVTLMQQELAPRGVYVQASTLGSLEALLSFLKQSQIPVSAVNLGPVHRKDVMRASIMLEREQAKEYGVMLCFDVKVEKEASQLAQELGVKIFTADIIYHLFDQFTLFMKQCQEQKRLDAQPQVVFPCVLKIVPNCVFNKRDPIIVGVDVEEGVLKVGTPLCVVHQGVITTLGKVTGIELNHKPVEVVKRGGPSVAIRIEHAVYETAKMVGRHFQESDRLLSRVTRESIDLLKENFRNEVTKDEWGLVVKLKKVLNIA